MREMISFCSAGYFIGRLEVSTVKFYLKLCQFLFQISNLKNPLNFKLIIKLN